MLYRDLPEGSRVTDVWVGSGHPDRPRKGGQTCGRAGTWLKVDKVWYYSPYRSHHEFLMRLNTDEHRCLAYIFKYNELLEIQKRNEEPTQAQWEELNELFF
jgi:hypothetical protein